MKKKSFVVITILLVIVILGLCAFIAYDKNLFNIKGENNKTKENVEEKKSEDETENIDINSDLVKNLVYPNVAIDIASIPKDFVLADLSISDYSRDTKMIAAQFFDYESLESEQKNYICTYSKDTNGNIIINGVVKEGNSGSLKDNELWCVGYPSASIKSNYIKLFGPDSEYSDESVNSTGCGFINYYDQETDNYYAYEACGGIYPSYDSIRKTYKAETKGEYLYVYDYAMITYTHDSVNGIALFDNYESFQKFEETDSVDYAKYIVQTEEEAQTKLEEEIKNNTANTYVWSFKKQSDGKYYYHSSKWAEN